MEDAGAATLDRWLARSDLQRLLGALLERGYDVRGPVLRDGAVVYDSVRSLEDLPKGWRDVQEPGAYRLERSGRERVFDVVHGPGGIKPYVFAPREPLLRIETSGLGGAFRAEPERPEPVPVALLGVRACDLAGLVVQDRIFLGDRFPDPYYAARRSRLFLVAVGCTRSVATCFCASMGTGPEPTAGFDLALTELDEGFVVRAGSEAGRHLLADLSLPELSGGVREREASAFEACAAGMKRRLDPGVMPDLLYENLEHPRWDAVAERCLSCGNCTSVCPTCFCHDERDEPGLDGVSLRVREWDSCFDREHAQIHGLNFRPRIRDRYRQWLVHKLAGWIDQFGTSGCVGCGRCITWCPVGIDLTEEVAAIAASPGERS
jgi:ferredoxin